VRKIAKHKKQIRTLHLHEKTEVLENIPLGLKTR
jgi:hypothetical protein